MTEKTYKLYEAIIAGRRYYGSSGRRQFYTRIAQHKYNSKTKSHIPFYEFVNNNGGWDNVEWNIIATFKTEAECLDAEYIIIDRDSDCLNVVKGYLGLGRKKYTQLPHAKEARKLQDSNPVRMAKRNMITKRTIAIKKFLGMRRCDSTSNLSKEQRDNILICASGVADNGMPVEIRGL